ncbi:MAG: ABC transporter substrate-binding protein [Actinobacteria bacterium]|nr:ABC transporter substrate-binding protein [Actinomycetota bacterium]
MKISRTLLTLLAVLFSFSLIAAACGSDDETGTDTGSAADTTEPDTTEPDTTEPDTTEPATTEPATTEPDTTEPDMVDSLGDGSLGTITVEPGDEVQIRSLNAITGDVAFLGIPNQAGIELAVADYGQIHGFDVTSGQGLDDLCSAEGGQAAAQQIVADEQVAGVIGTSCSGAAAAAAPLIGENGLVMISGSNTSPSLTSDLLGTANENYRPGYYRTAHNDLFQGAAMADFVFNDLGLTTAAAIHDGDPYTQGLSQAFADAYEALGGEMVGFTGVNKEDTDMVPVLTEVAAQSPQALFFPIFQPAADFIADQAAGIDGLGDTQLLAADGILVDGFLELPQSEGMYFSGPDTRFGTNTNESTGQTADAVLAAYIDKVGEAPSAAFWGHSYDATAMLLDAIAAASHVDADGNLVIDKAGIREYLNAISDYSGLIGSITCDEFGDCGSQKITIVKHDDSTDIEASKVNVVFEFAP